MSSAGATQLKLKALELKKAGDLDGAKQLLAQARAIEFENITVEELNDASELKRLAVVLKRKGDIAGAKQALVKAKGIEAGNNDTAAVASARHHERRTSSPPRPSVAQQVSARIPCFFNASAAAATTTTTTNDPADDGRSTNYLAQTDSVTAELRKELSPSGPVTFDDDEMADVETMADLQTMGMDMPSEEQYNERVKANKLEALGAKKRGDIEAAKRHLYKSKQLEAARIQLYANMEEDGSDDEDYSLLDELNCGPNEEDDAFFAELFGADNNVLDLDDLDNFDAEMLRDMIDVGMVVPDPDDVLQEAQEKKSLAVSLHKQGNSAAAKAALAESKKLQSQAERLAEMMAEAAGADEESGDDMAVLMALLKGSDGPRPAAASRTNGEAAAAPLVPKVPTKTAHDWKIEAVQMKQQGKLTEATKALRMYKQALAEEANKEEMENRKKTVAELNEEIQVAEVQIARFIFYERFVDANAGAAQLVFWRKYALDCSRAIKLLETMGTGVIAMSRTESGGGKRILNDDLSFIINSVDSSDERLEIAFLGASNIQDNKHLKKALRQRMKELQRQQKDKDASVALEVTPRIRIDVTIQLPPSENESDGNIQFAIEPKPADGKEGCYQAETPSKYIDLPRGKSKYAKTILRRMERKRIQFAVVYVPPTAKRGLFGLAGKNTKEAASQTESSLGIVSFELKDFLQNRSVAGEFPIMDSMRRNELGGSIKVGIRTGMPFDLDAIEAQSALTELTGYKLTNVGESSTAAELKPFEALIFTTT
jgi:hypothetical protein